MLKSLPSLEEPNGDPRDRHWRFILSSKSLW